MASDFKSIPPEQTINFLEKTLSFISSLCYDPLFSTIITLYTLILLYFPSIFFKIVFSPVLISTGISLLILLRFGAIQRTKEKLNCITEPQLLPEQHDSEFELGQERDPDSKAFFAEWNVKAPLEVIYEGEEEENDVVKQDKRVPGINRYSSLSLYYSESDSDCSSDDDISVMGDWDSPERICLMWDEEDKDGLIEISLEGKRNMEFFHAEEDNLIEIDIFADEKR